jgi:hypothetical protein
MPVLEHNRLDLLSLAVLTSTALQMAERGASSARTVRECLGLGQLYDRAGMGDRAALCYTHAASGDLRGSRRDRAEALRSLARRMRRERRHDEAAGAWQQILAIDRHTHGLTREAAHALAVHHEHRSRDLEAAHRYAVCAATAAATRADRIKAGHRLARLERKLGLRSGEAEAVLFES